MPLKAVESSIKGHQRARERESSYPVSEPRRAHGQARQLRVELEIERVASPGIHAFVFRFPKELDKELS